MSLGQRARSFALRDNMRYSVGGSPCTARKARLKSPGLGKPHLAPMAATGREASAGSDRSRRQHSSRRFLIQPATVRPSSWKSRCRERSDMWCAAAIMAGERPAVTQVLLDEGLDRGQQGMPAGLWRVPVDWRPVHAPAGSQAPPRAAVDRRAASPGLQWSILRASWSRNCDVTSPRPAPAGNGTAASCLSWFRDMRQQGRREHEGHHLNRPVQGRTADHFVGTPGVVEGEVTRTQARLPAVLADHTGAAAHQRYLQHVRIGPEIRAGVRRTVARGTAPSPRPAWARARWRGTPQGSAWRSSGGSPSAADMAAMTSAGNQRGRALPPGPFE